MFQTLIDCIRLISAGIFSYCVRRSTVDSLYDGKQKNVLHVNQLATAELYNVWDALARRWFVQGRSLMFHEACLIVWEKEEVKAYPWWADFQLKMVRKAGIALSPIFRQESVSCRSLKRECRNIILVVYINFNKASNEEKTVTSVKIGR